MSSAAVDNPLARALGTVRSLAGRTVTYRRGNQSVDLQAAEGRSSFDSLDDQGIATVTETRDFLIAAVDLVLAGLTTRPVQGDRIEVQRSVDGQSVTETFAVVRGLGDAPYSVSDPAGSTLRVHTQLVATTAADSSAGASA